MVQGRSTIRTAATLDNIDWAGIHIKSHKDQRGRDKQVRCGILKAALL